jgi:tetratricopeptide (TPR) repeat protein
VGCFNQALTIDPRDAKAWFNKVVLEDFMRNWRAAATSYKKFLELTESQDAPPRQIEHAHQRIHELESKTI